MLRILSYNILHGGGKRQKKILHIIKKINPDICGILEAVGWQNKEKYFKHIANNLGYDFFYLAVANSKYNIAIFSKISLKLKLVTRKIRHIFVKTTIIRGSFKGFNIFFIHLSPLSEKARLVEVEELLKYITKSSKAIIMGDFNSLSSSDPYNKKELLKIFQKNNIKKYGEKRLYFDVIKKIESSRFIDAVKVFNHPFEPTTPTPSNKDFNHATNIRIDYAFVTKNIIKNLKKIEVVKNKITNQASDHYPIFIELV